MLTNVFNTWMGYLPWERVRWISERYHWESKVVMELASNDPTPASPFYFLVCLWAHICKITWDRKKVEAGVWSWCLWEYLAIMHPTLVPFPAERFWKQYLYLTPQFTRKDMFDSVSDGYTCIVRHKIRLKYLHSEGLKQPIVCNWIKLTQKRTNKWQASSFCIAFTEALMLDAKILVPLKNFFFFFFFFCWWVSQLLASNRSWNSEYF